MSSGCCPPVKRKPFVMPAFAGMYYKSPCLQQAGAFLGGLFPTPLYRLGRLFQTRLYHLHPCRRACAGMTTKMARARMNCLICPQSAARRRRIAGVACGRHESLNDGGGEFRPAPACGRQVWNRRPRNPVAYISHSRASGDDNNALRGHSARHRPPYATKNHSASKIKIDNHSCFI